MSRFVVDASVGSKWFVKEPDHAIAARLLTEYIQGTHELIAPDLFLAEVTNSLLVAERSGRVSGVPLALAAILATGPALQSTPRDIHRAYEMARECKVSVYDCLYLAMAEREQCELVTADTAFRHAVFLRYGFVVALQALP